MSSNAAPAKKRPTLTHPGSENYDKEKTFLTIIAGILFVSGCTSYLIGNTFNLPAVNDPDAWMFNAIGAGSFILCGLVEYCNYMGTFHMFLVLAGILGLAAEVMDSQQNPASVPLNFVANHMFFCEAVKIYYAHSADYYFMEIASKYIMIETLKLADLCFVLGTLIDLVLSWIYLLVGAVDPSSATHLSDTRTDEHKIIEEASASLWFVCSILTLIVYIQMARAKAKAGEEDDDDDEKTKLSTGV